MESLHILYGSFVENFLARLLKKELLNSLGNKRVNVDFSKVQIFPFLPDFHRTSFSMTHSSLITRATADFFLPLDRASIGERF